MTREEAVEVIKDFVAYGKHVNAFVYKGSTAIPIEALNMAIEALEQEPKWIPATERLAEFPCIIQDANGNNPSVPSGIVTVESKEHGTWQIDGKFWTDKDLNPYLNWHNRIIAWQPLPEPYEGE